MSLTLYRRHTSRCSQGRSRHERNYESDELRRGFKKCQCPIQFEGKISGVGFVRKSTERTSWQEAKLVAASWESGVATVPAQLPCAQAVAEPAAAKRDEPVTIELVASEFMADIEARQMDEATRRKYRTMLKQLQGYADEFGFRYLSQFTVEELTKFRGSWKERVPLRRKETGARPRGFPLRPGARMDPAKPGIQAEAADRLQQAGKQTSLLGRGSQSAIRGLCEI